MDFSFKNELISNYFKGDNTYVPISELLYVHEHPLLVNTFLHELDVLITKTSELIKRINLKGSVVNQFATHTINFGAQLPDIRVDNAPIILSELRNIYILCNGLLKQYGVN